MSTYLRYGIIENLDTVRRIPLGRFWGVAVLVTPLTWLSPFVFFGLHFARDRHSRRRLLHRYAE
jgi:hypothetical protein